jgi:hypothetical protein
MFLENVKARDFTGMSVCLFLFDQIWLDNSGGFYQQEGCLTPKTHTDTLKDSKII